MTDTQHRLLAAIVAEPGEWTAAYHAELIAEDPAAVRDAVYRLAEHGYVAPRAYRLHGHARAKLAAGRQPGELTGWAMWRADAWRTSHRLIRELESGPLSREKRVLSGAEKKVMRVLHDIGIVSLPDCLWPTDEGIALVRERRAA